MRFETKDIVTVESGIICQQVNCQGVMGAGLARQIAMRYPAVKRRYEEFCRGSGDKSYFLGKILPVNVSQDKTVVCLFGQELYGRLRRHTNYGALANCLYELRKYSAFRPIYIPKGMGCGLGGGDWAVVSELIDHILSAANVTICVKE